MVCLLKTIIVALSHCFPAHIPQNCLKAAFTCFPYSLTACVELYCGELLQSENPQQWAYGRHLNDPKISAYRRTYYPLKKSSRRGCAANWKGRLHLFVVASDTRRTSQPFVDSLKQLLTVNATWKRHRIEMDPPVLLSCLMYPSLRGLAPNLCGARVFTLLPEEALLKIELLELFRSPRLLAICSLVA